MDTCWTLSSCPGRAWHYLRDERCLWQVMSRPFLDMRAQSGAHDKVISLHLFGFRRWNILHTFHSTAGESCFSAPSHAASLLTATRGQGGRLWMNVFELYPRGHETRCIVHTCSLAGGRRCLRRVEAGCSQSGFIARVSDGTVRWCNWDIGKEWLHTGPWSEREFHTVLKRGIHECWNCVLISS